MGEGLMMQDRQIAMQGLNTLGGMLGGALGGALRPAGTVTSWGGRGRGANILEGIGIGGVPDYAAAATKAKALRQTLKAYAPDDESGDALRQFADSAGLADLEGKVQGFALKAAQAHQQAQTEETRARTQELLDAGQRYRAQAAHANALDIAAAEDANHEQNFLQQWVQAAQGGVESPGSNVEGQPSTSGARPSTAVNPLLAAINASPRGAAVAFRRNPSLLVQALHIVPNVGAPGDVGTAQEVQDSDGNVIGHNIPIGGGKWHYQPKPKEANAGYPEGSKVVSDRGVNLLVGPDGRIIKTLGAQSAGGALSDYLGGQSGAKPNTATPAGKSPSAQALALPKSKADLKAGQAYITPRGIATWDGEKFVTRQ